MSDNNQDNKSLIVADDQPEAETKATLASELGGLQALALLVAVGVVALIVIAFPTPENPAVPDDVALAEITEEAAATEATSLVTEEASAETEEPVVTEVPTEDAETDTAEMGSAESVTEEALTAEAPIESATEAVMDDADEAQGSAEMVTEEPPAATEEAAEAETTVPVTEEASAETEEPAEVAVVPDIDYDAVVAEAIAAGDPANGEMLFNTTHQTSFGTWMCASCHTVAESQVRLVGPPMWGLHERLPERVTATGETDPINYIQTSIRNPQAYIVPGEPPYPENMMPQNWAEIFTDEEINDLIAYLLTVGNENTLVEAPVEVAQAATEEAAVETEEAAVETEEAAVETEEAAVETEEAVEVAMQEGDFDALIMATLETGDIENGEALFSQTLNTAVGPWMCASCHSVDESQARLVGPPMWGLHERVADRVTDSGETDPIAYIHNSMLMPQAYIVPEEPPYAANLMPPNYAELLTEQEVADLTAYMLSLGNENLPAVEAEEPAVETEEPASMGRGQGGEGRGEGQGGQGNGQQGEGRGEGQGGQGNGQQGEGRGQGQGGQGGPDNAVLIAEAIAAGDPARGQELFNTTYQTNVGPWICASCHSVDEMQTRLVGPGLYGIYERAETERLPEAEVNPRSVVGYLHQSILMPQVYIVPADPAYPENLMPGNYDELLSEQDLVDLTAYILTLGNPDAD